MVEYLEGFEVVMTNKENLQTGSVQANTSAARYNLFLPGFIHPSIEQFRGCAWI